MAGHSKWANIKHKKSRQDAKKGKAFSQVTKEIIIAVKLGGDDPKTNPRLRLALQKAKEVNLPKENIERNIKKAASSDTASYEEVQYEIYGHGGVGILVCALTDNKNRTASEMRIAVNKKGGSLASVGSVSFQFSKKGVHEIQKKEIPFDEFFMLAVEHGAEDVEEKSDAFLVITPPEALYQFKEALESEGYIYIDAEISHIPNSLISVSQEDQAKNELLIDFLEFIDDVEMVYSNMGNTTE